MSSFVSGNEARFASSVEATPATVGRIPDWVYRLFVAFAWLSILYTYTPAKRVAPQGLGDLDTLGFLKLAHRGFSIVAAAALVHGITSSGRFGPVARRLALLVAFGAFAAISMWWSPFPAKSLGKAIGVLVAALYALSAGVLAADNDERWHSIIRQLAILCIFVTVCNIIAELLTNGGNALHMYRYRSDVARDGVLMHAGAMANIAGLGLFLAYAHFVLFRSQWAIRALLVAVPLCALMLFITNSRASTAATILALGGVTVLGVGIRISLLGVLPALLVGLYMLIGDASSGTFDKFADKVQRYALRGQSVSEFQSLSGRDEKWEMAMEGFENALFLGGGYDSVEGFDNIFINGRWQPLPVHNLYLFILTGLGLIGITLFVLGIAFVLVPLLPRILKAGPRRGQAMLLAAGISIFLLVGYTEVIFISGNGVGSTVAYVLIGLAAAEVTRPRSPYSFHEAA